MTIEEIKKAKKVITQRIEDAGEVELSIGKVFITLASNMPRIKKQGYAIIQMLDGTFLTLKNPTYGGLSGLTDDGQIIINIIEGGKDENIN